MAIFALVGCAGGGLVREGSVVGVGEKSLFERPNNGASQ